jgi:hypothetical protein
MDGKKKKAAGKWDRRRRRWVPDVVSPDYRSMVLDDTYDEPAGEMLPNGAIRGPKPGENGGIGTNVPEG